TPSNALNEYIGGYSKLSDRSERTATESPSGGASIDLGTGCPSNCSRTEQLEIPITNATPSIAARPLTMVSVPLDDESLISLGRLSRSPIYIEQKTLAGAELYEIESRFSFSPAKRRSYFRWKRNNSGAHGPRSRRALTSTQRAPVQVDGGKMVPGGGPTLDLLGTRSGSCKKLKTYCLALPIRARLP